MDETGPDRAWGAWQGGCPRWAGRHREAHGEHAPGSPLLVPVSVSSIPSSQPSHLCCSLQFGAACLPPPPCYDLIFFSFGQISCFCCDLSWCCFSFFFFSSFSPSSYCDHSKPCSCPVPTSRYQPFYHRCLDLCTIDLTAAPAAECHPSSPPSHAPCVRVRPPVPPSLSPTTRSTSGPPGHFLCVLSPPAPLFLSGSGLDPPQEETDSLPCQESVAC